MTRLLIVGCGDVARRALPLLVRRYRVYALLRKSGASWRELAGMGVTRIAGDLDDRRSLKRLAGLDDIVLHLAPPAGEFGSPEPDQAVKPRGPARKVDEPSDRRTRNLIAALSTRKTRARNSPAARKPARKILSRRLIYISTSGVYGDCAGALVDETRPPRPSSPRAGRRLDAEQRLRHWLIRGGPPVSILRVAGIYAANRLPLPRLRRGDPALRREEDVATNLIHADDLARVVLAALRRGRPGRSYNVCDNSRIRMGDWFDLVADAHGLARPPRISREEAADMLSPAMLSFLAESRRLDNSRMRRELQARLRYPEAAAGLRQARLSPGQELP